MAEPDGEGEVTRCAGAHVRDAVTVAQDVERSVQTPDAHVPAGMGKGTLEQLVPEPEARETRHAGERRSCPG